MDWKTTLAQLLVIAAPFIVAGALYLTKRLKDYVDANVANEKLRFVASKALEIVLFVEQKEVDVAKSLGAWNDAAKARVLQAAKDALMAEIKSLTQQEAVQAVEAAVKKTTLATQGPVTLPTPGGQITADSVAR